MKIEYKEPSVTKSDFISSIQMPEIYIEAFEPVEGNFFYNKNLKGYQLKQKNPQYNLVVDNRVKKTEDKYKRDGRRKYIDFIDVYVKLEEQP